jgi:lysine-N-methylase
MRIAAGAIDPAAGERRLRQNRLIRPTYAEKFRCIGAACEDTCCQGWSVPIDQKSFEKYQQMPDVPLKALILSSLQGPEPGAEPDPKSWARIRMVEGNQCPLLLPNKLCRIQSEFGHDFLSHVCAVYPRNIHNIDDYREISLSLSCPEAARLVLLDPDLLACDLLPVHESDERIDAQIDLQTTRNPQQTETCVAGVADGAEAAHEEKQPTGVSLLLSSFWLIRATILELLRNRDYPLWQRMFLLSILCSRLDAIARGEINRSVPDFLNDFEMSVATGALKAAMETLPLDRTAQLDVVLRLAGSMLHRSNVRPRFVEIVQAFTSGIGNGPGATLESLSAHYAFAHDRYYAPFIESHPHILENYLVNTMLRGNFPFGKNARGAGERFAMSREFALLTAQFALMKGLLIGVAGHHRQAFNADHIVHTFQAAAKHFEHHPEFLNQAHALLVESRMDGARGMAILLRNTAPAEPRPATAEIRIPAMQA